jgi:hypothetical protein
MAVDEDALEAAILKHVNAMSIEELQQFVIDDLWDYYVNADTYAIEQFLEDVAKE